MSAIGRTRFVWTAGAAALLAACGASPRKFPADPAFTADVGYFGGSPLAGALPPLEEPPIDPNPDAAFAVEFRVIYVERMPREAMEPLASNLNLVAGLRSDEPLFPGTFLASEVRVGFPGTTGEFLKDLEDGRFGRRAPVAVLRAALPENVTAYAEIAREPPAHVLGRELRVEVARGAEDKRETLTVTLVLEGIAPDLSLSAFGSNAPTRTRHRRDAAVLEDRLKVDGDPILFVVPARFGGEFAAAFVVSVEAGHCSRVPEEAAVHAVLTASCIREVAAACELASRRATPIAPLELAWRQLSEAVRDMPRSGAKQRAALLYIAQIVRAETTADLAFVADDATMQAYGDRIVELVPDFQEMARDGTTLAWFLERTTFRFLGARLDAGTLPPELQSVLFRQAGAVGGDDEWIEETLEDSTDLESWRAQLLAENRDGLEDIDPAIRLRSFEWLEARGWAPRGFDPLGPVLERTRVLREAESAASRQARKP